jgi:protoheme IX farnesyltransferase
LKRRSTLNTAVGAVSGALPPVLGWAAADGGVGLFAGILFLIVFLWQFPHFLAIAWIHRHDYARVGMKMLPAVDPDGVVTGYHVLAYTLTLLPVSLGPAVFGMAGPWYFLGACGLGTWFLLFAVRFWMHTGHARALLRASLVYLPALLALLLIDHHAPRRHAGPLQDRGRLAYRVAAIDGAGQPLIRNTDK